MKFDYELIEEYCRKLEIALNNIKSKYDDCDSQINYIKSSDSWVGPAASNFMTKAKKSINVCRMNEKALNSVINYIRQCSKNYESLEKDIGKEISSLTE